MKTIRVAAAVIRRGSQILAAERGYGEFRDGWEFPGGKIESGETAEEALKRELKEEMNAEVIVNEKITTVEMDYPEFHLSMDAFLVSLADDHLELLEHEAACWLDYQHLDDVNWLPADQEIVRVLKEKHMKGC
ncbi:MAG: (deoxy)nucleoside triphosphate pyrophosphohydrolase [Anaerolactibacter massiliensis]|nr:(deoxy)nucleoside triphosphate pyrophosphohydrolase [Anaerolactibacter massiliensis]